MPENLIYGFFWTVYTTSSVAHISLRLLLPPPESSKNGSKQGLFSFSVVVPTDKEEMENTRES